MHYGVIFVLAILSIIFIGGGIVSASNTINVCDSCNYTTIQDAIDNATDGDSIKIVNGTYPETVTINKQVSIFGSPDGNTIITGNPAIQLNASGTMSNPISLNDLTLNSTNGITMINSDISYISLNNVNAMGDGTTIDSKGFEVPLNYQLDGLMIENSSFRNFAYGFYLVKYSGGPLNTSLSHATISNTGFQGNIVKGFYTESLNESSFDNCDFSGNGNNVTITGNSAYASPFGLELNLKYEDYKNIEFTNLVVTNNGLASQKGGGIHIAARGTGVDTFYNPPATITNLTINGGIVKNNERGIVIGEPNKSLQSPTELNIHNVNFSNNIQTYNRTDGSPYGDLVNVLDQSISINATNNYWGSANPNFNEITSGNVTVSPWWMDGDMTLSSVFIQIFDQTHNTLVSDGITNNLDTCGTTPDNCLGLYFERTDLGKITFSVPLDLTNEATQTYLENLNSTFSQAIGRIALDVSSISQFQNKGAILEMYNLPNVTIGEGKLIVRNDNGTPADYSSIVNNFTYYSGNNTATIEVNHFTQFDLDLTAPNTTDDSPSELFNSPVTVNFTCTDDIAGCFKTFYTTDNSTPTTNSSNGTSVTIDNDGTYNLRYFSVDGAGNIEKVQNSSNTFTIDMTPPTTGITGAPNGLVNTTQVINFTCTDEHGCITYYTTDNSTPTTSSASGDSVTLTDDGNYTIKYFSVDSLGNAESIKASNFFVIDKTAPATTDDSQSGLVNTTQVINFDCTDEHGCITYYTTDGSDPTTSSDSGDSVIVSEEGPYVLKYFSVDSAGNSEDIVTSNQFIIDKTAPEVTDNSSNELFNTTQTIYLNCTDANGCDNTYYTTDNSTPTMNSENGSSVTLGEEGNYTIKYFSVDGAGNRGNISTLNEFTIDKTPPITTDNSVAGYYNASQNIGLTCTDANGCESTYYAINATPTTSSERGTRITLDNEGIYTIKYFSVDNAGNIGEINNSKEITIDKTAPSMDLNNLTIYDNESLNEDISSKITDTSGINSYIVNEGSSASEMFEINQRKLINKTNIAPDTYTLTIIAIDNAGNNNFQTITLTVLSDKQELAQNESIEIDNETEEIVFNDQSSDVKNITIPSSVNSTQEVKLDLTAIKSTNATTNETKVTIPGNITLFRNSNTTNYSVEIPSETIINGTGWDGKLTLPTVKPTNENSISGGNIDVIIDIGSGTALNLSKAVKIVLSGMSGKNAAWARGNDTMTQITTQCISATNSSNIVGNGECYFDDGTDLIIWTYHFTKFAAFTPVTAATTVITSGGGSSYCSTQWNCTDWSVCTDGTQTRTCSYPTNFCAPASTKPVETQSCIVSNGETPTNETVTNETPTQSRSFITGLVTGTGEAISSTAGMIILGVIFILLALVLIREKKNKSKGKKTSKKSKKK